MGVVCYSEQTKLLLKNRHKMDLEAFISSYGYAAVAIGTFLEGETILALAGFAAHRGYLQLPWVIVSAFLGTLLGDQLFYYMGRYKGQSILDKHPGWKTKADKIFRLLEKHQTLLIIGFRFLYGLRSITPTLIGLSKVAPTKFLVLNILGAAIWAISIGTLGYFFGQTLELVIADIKHYEVLVGFIFVVIGIVVWSYHFRKQKYLQKNSSDGENQ